LLAFTTSPQRAIFSELIDALVFASGIAGGFEPERGELPEGRSA